MSTHGEHHHHHKQPKPHAVTCQGTSIHGWKISTRKGPIISDRDVDAFREAVGEDTKTLPEMLFSSSRVSMLHEPSGIALDFTALGALQAWLTEKLPPLQVKAAKEWRAAREHEIAAQGAVQLEYDWTFTSPYLGDIVTGSIASRRIGPGDTGQYADAGECMHVLPSAQTSADHPTLMTSRTIGTSLKEADAIQAASHTQSPHDIPRTAQTKDSAPASENTASESKGSQPDHPHYDGQQHAGAMPSVQLPTWQETTEQIDRALLMERDPILFFDEVPLFESDLDDNGVSQMTVKLRVMPRAWLLLLRFWLRVDGCMVRLRETRLFCRHDTPQGACTILREQRHCEGTFAQLRAAGAPGEGPAWIDADSAGQAFQAVAPIGLKLMKLDKLVLPANKIA